MSCVEKAYAKVNLTLAVGEKRPDGYHEVVSVMQRVSLHDTLTAERTASGISLTCSDPALPAGEENLAHRAATLFFRETGITGGAALALEKSIPSQAGLGGGSSDAASVLLALRRLYAPALSDTALEAMAAALGSDVPFCVRGGTCLAEGRGEILTDLPPLPDCPSYCASRTSACPHRSCLPGWTGRTWAPGRIRRPWQRRWPGAIWPPRPPALEMFLSGC